MSVHFFPENPSTGGGTDPGFITLTGDVTGSGSGTISTALPAITTGKTNVTKITYNSKGLVTGGTSLTDLDLPVHTHTVAISGDVTGTGSNSSIAVTLSPVTTAGSGIKVTYDDKGRVLSTTGLTTIDLPVHTHNVTLTGDVTGTGTNSSITTALPVITSPGTGIKVTYTGKGLVTGSTTLSDTDLPPHPHTVTLTGDVTGTGSNSNIVTTLPAITTGKTATKITYTNKGLVLDGTTLSDTDLPVHSHTVTLTGDITGTGSNSNITTSLPTITSPNTATKITYTAKGLVSSGTTLSDTDLPPHTHTVTVTGDVTGTGLNNALTLTLPNLLTAGTYPKVTVNAKGQVTAGSALLASDIPSLDWSKITTGKPTTLNGYGITDALTIAGTGLTSTGNTLNAVGTSGRIVANADSIDLATTGTAGTYTKCTTDGYGRVVSGTTLSASDIPDLDTSKISTGVFPDVRIPYKGTPADCWTSQCIGVPIFGSYFYSEGSYFTTISSNGYRNTSNLWTSLGVNGNTGASTINLLPDGVIRFSTDSIKSTGDSYFVTERMRIGGTGIVNIYASTPSTSTTTGALVVAGGVGCQDLYATSLNGQLKLNTYTTATRPTPSASRLGQIWLNTSTGKIEYVATASTIQSITSA